MLERRPTSHDLLLGFLRLESVEQARHHRVEVHSHHRVSRVVGRPRIGRLHLHHERRYPDATTGREKSSHEPDPTPNSHTRGLTLLWNLFSYAIDGQE